MPHTPGKLEVSIESKRILVSADNRSVIVGSAAGYTGSGYFPDDDTAEVNAERIAACWNALDGLDPADVPRLRAERDELLAACKAVAEWYDAWGTIKQEDAALAMVRAAIANAERKAVTE